MLESTMVRDPPAICVTFGSMKGGMGCSTTAANAAADLVLRHGKRVLLMDWDLETPSLKDLFHTPRKRPGLLEYLVDSRMEFERIQSAHPNGESIPAPTRLDDYTFDVTSTLNGDPGAGRLSVMTAGIEDAEFHRRVEGFDWTRFYDSEGGFWIVERLRWEACDSYDLVLLDARSGHLGLSVIPYLHMADLVVLLFADNEVGIRGASWLARAMATHKSRGEWGRAPVSFLLAPARLRSDPASVSDYNERLSRVSTSLGAGGGLPAAGLPEFPLHEDVAAEDGGVVIDTSEGRRTRFGIDVMRLVDAIASYQPVTD